MEIYNVLVQGVPLIFVVMGLVEYVKKLGLTGNAVTVASMVIGLLFGVGYMFANTGVPADFGGWFGYGVYGIGLGLVASGIYDTGKAIIEKGIALLLAAK